MLIEIKTFLSGRGPASLSEIARRLSADADAVRPMLDYWIRKGRIRQIGTAARCRGCTSCTPADLEIYEWAAAPSPSPDDSPQDG